MSGLSEDTASVTRTDGTLVDEADAEKQSHAPQEYGVDGHGGGEGPELHALDDEDLPDGGLKAWSVIVGAWCIIFVSFGTFNAFGSFADYLITHQLSNVSPSTISWIGSLQIFLIYIGGLVLGYLFDVYGTRVMNIIGTVFLLLGMFMFSLCDQYWQAFLALGVCTGIGQMFLFTPTNSAGTTWFRKKRGLAMGIVASGSSLGGMTFPILVNNLFNRLSFGWTIRCMAFVQLLLLLIGNPLVSRRTPKQHPDRSLPKRKIIDLDGFKIKAYTFFCIGCFFLNLGLYTPFFYIQQYAGALGVDTNLAFYLLPIMNAASAVGRILPGYIADRVGRYNLIGPFCIIAGLLQLVFWPFCETFAHLVGFAILYGIFSGAFICLINPCIAQICPVEFVGSRLGMIFACSAIAALVGTPIAGAILAAQNGAYLGVQLYSGIIAVVGGVVMIFARLSIDRRLRVIV